MNERRQQVLDFIRKFIDDKQYPPTYEEIRVGCSMSSKSLVDFHLGNLEVDGKIKRPHSSPRCIVLVKSRCDDCGGELTAEEIEVPERNPAGQIICCSCERNYQFTCCLCQNYAPDVEQGAIGNLVVITDSERAEMAAGVYEVKSHPYYTDSMLAMWFNEDALLRLGDVPDRIDTDSAAAGHLCGECSQEIKQALGVAA